MGRPRGRKVLVYVSMWSAMDTTSWMLEGGKRKKTQRSFAIDCCRLNIAAATFPQGRNDPPMTGTIRSLLNLLSSKEELLWLVN